MKYFIGIDVGTQSLRVCLFSQNGDKRFEYTEDFTTSYPAPLQVEQDPEKWWTATIHALKEITNAEVVDVEDIAGICYACTSCTVVVLDQNGSSLRPAIMWMDERAITEAEQITRTENSVLQYSGGIVSPQWMLPKTAWLLKNEPEVFKKAYRIVEQTDYFTFKLTGLWTLGYNNLVTKWNYASLSGGWPEGFLRDAGVEVACSKWPKKILKLGEPVGRIKTELADETGLSRDTLVLQGGVDSHAAMVGLSVIAPGDLGIVMGTSTVIMGQSDTPIFADIWGPYPDAVIDGTFTIGGGQTTTGSVIDWLVSELSLSGINKDLQRIGALEREAEHIPPGSNGLVALNYFQGNRTPIKDPKARGAIWGLTLWHSLPHILRAFYESNAYGTRHFVENLEQHGFEVNRIIAGGGGAKSDLGISILGSVLGRPILTTQESECTAIGTAVLASIGCGVHKNYEQAVQQMIKIEPAREWSTKDHSVYDFYYDKYLQTYTQLKDLFHEVVDFEELNAVKRVQ